MFVRRGIPVDLSLLQTSLFVRAWTLLSARFDATFQLEFAGLQIRIQSILHSPRRGNRFHRLHRRKIHRSCHALCPRQEAHHRFQSPRSCHTDIRRLGFN